VTPETEDLAAKYSAQCSSMSRIASTPVSLPQGTEARLHSETITISGEKGSLELVRSPLVEVVEEGGFLRVRVKEKNNRQAVAMAGTTRVLLANMVQGVSSGFEKKLLLQGIGYRVALQGRKLNLTLGFSHPVVDSLPEGIEAEVPNQNEISIRGIDKQKVGQTAAEIRAFRPVEPYKGKGVRYANERVVQKEAKKK